MTDEDRWSAFSRAVKNYSAYFGPNGKTYHAKYINPVIEDALVMSIANLTSRQKLESIKDIGNLLIHCYHNQKKFQDLISTALVSSDTKKCLGQIVSVEEIIGKNTCSSEEEIYEALARANPGFIIHREYFPKSDKTERRVYVGSIN